MEYILAVVALFCVGWVLNSMEKAIARKRERQGLPPKPKVGCKQHPYFLPGCPGREVSQHLDPITRAQAGLQTLNGRASLAVAINPRARHLLETNRPDVHQYGRGAEKRARISAAEPAVSNSSSVGRALGGEGTARSPRG
jgi:hypothetical protein